MAGTPGSYAVTDWVAMDCLRLLTNMLAMAGYANFTYQDEFKKDFQPGDTVRVKFPQEFVVTDTFEYTAQAINRQTTTLTVDQPMQIGFEWDSIEEALKLERTQEQIREEYNKPAMEQMAQEFELRFMDFAFFNANNVVGTLGAIPTSWDVYAQARQRMVENAGWGANSTRAIGVTPAMMRTMITNSLTQFNPTDAISQQYKTGSVGKAAGWDWFESMSCHQHTTGVWATVATGVTTSTGSQSGSTLTVACTTGDTFLRGDIINIAGVNNVNPRTKRSTGTLKQFKITASTTGAASTATLNILPAIIGPGSPYQNVDALPGNGVVLTLWPGTTMANATAKSGVLGMGVNKLAFAMAGVELMMPKEGGVVKIAQQKKDPNTGISIAALSMFDGILRRQINRFDALIGFGPLYQDRCAVLVASSQ